MRHSLPCMVLTRSPGNTGVHDLLAVQTVQQMGPRPAGLLGLYAETSLPRGSHSA